MGPEAGKGLREVPRLVEPSRLDSLLLLTPLAYNAYFCGPLSLIMINLVDTLLIIFTCVEPSR